MKLYKTRTATESTPSLKMLDKLIRTAGSSSYIPLSSCLVFAVCFSLLAGCEDPLSYLAFESDGTTRDHVKLSLDSGRVALEMMGRVHYEGQYYCDLSLGLRIRTRSRIDSVSVVCDSIQVWYFYQEMEFQGTTEWSKDHDPRRGRYAFWADYRCPSLLERLPRSPGNRISDVMMRIKISGVIVLNDAPISIDTIVAWNRLADRYSDVDSAHIGS